MVEELVLKSPCGFCGTGSHESCAVGTLKPTKDAVWVCPCCGVGNRKCLNCNNRNTDEVSADTWTCLDSVACRSLVDTKRNSDPFYAKLREARKKATMAKAENTEKKSTARAKAEPKVGKCLVTGEPTKGGLFKPGMDARYVSIQVNSVVDANFTKTAEDKARKQMKSDGVSESLIGKFDKSLRIAREKAEKAKAAEAEKKAAKADKASAK